MTRRAWLTPDGLPASTVCITLNVPADEDFYSILKGAISALFEPENWEQSGALTPEECAQWWVEWDGDNDWPDC